MSEFQVALFALGALVILVVLGVNLWQGRRSVREDARPQTEPLFEQDFVGSGWHSRFDSDAFPHDGKEGSAPSHTQPRPAMDAVIDAICPIDLEQPLAGETILKALPTRQAIGGKPVLVEGKDAQSGQWEPPQAEHHYNELNISVQLANRKGPLTQVECGEFTALAFYFAQSLDASARFPDTVEVLQQANALDTFAERCDQVLSLALKPRTQAWTPTQLREAARLEGLEEQEGTAAGGGESESKMLRFALRDGHVIVATLVAAGEAQINSATVMLYVPAVPAEKEPFGRMLELCRKLQFNLGAEIVDENGQPLLESQLKTISERLSRIYEIMQLQGIAAGSESALRLFSD